MIFQRITQKTGRLLVFWSGKKYNSRKQWILGSVVAVFMVAILVPHIAQAGNVFVNVLLEGIAHIILWIVTLFGKILVVLIQILLAVISYNDFINVPAVVKGWVVVRDVFNLVFILIMMLIAISTITGASFLKQYNGQQMVFKLLTAAVFVNFSRLESLC